MVAATIFTAETVAAYVKNNLDKLPPDLVDAIAAAGGGSAAGDDDNDHWSVSPILGGNVNYAFCVTILGEHNNVKIFVKQAPEFVAIFGPDGFALTSERMQHEMDVYAEWRAMLGDQVASQYLPNLYFFDKEHMAVCMEFLDGFALLDHVLVASSGVDLPCLSAIAAGLGDFMGRTHAATHSSKMDAERKEYLVQHYENRPMRDIQLEFVFTKCYKEATDEQRAGLNVDAAFQQEIETLKAQYNGQSESLVLCHGDLHPGSVMVNKDGLVKVIDPEFTVYGPPGLDVGSLLSGFCLGAIHQAFAGNPKAVDDIVVTCGDIWQAYLTALKAGGIVDESLLRAIEVETVGFTVAEVCRTALEFAGGRKWLQFDDPVDKLAAKKAALALVDRCMVARHNGGMTLMLSALKEVAIRAS